ncbi:hypothetical protein FA95DRAFT_1558312 [Auriscalpium vulgare]|uniref:Uncharacterized protein n=1 Tax=Auriscalpium vulgare TaxID=40419 RepID=A0ACB8RVH0_9AGAM|nr:hypothetical protein FA95DRAFT_1558312 [Auriscalpium vulgare]
MAAAGFSQHVEPALPRAKYSFDAVTANLMRLGTMSLETFLLNPSAEPPIPDTFLYPTAGGTNPFYLDAHAASSTEAKTEEKRATHHNTPIFVLHQVCSQEFGSIEPLKYEILEEHGKEKKHCILTITRPNGSIRSYTTKPEFARKADARAAAAAVAVEMGALDFIKHGAPDVQAKKGLVLAPLDAPSTIKAVAPVDTRFIREVEECCVDWRAGRVRPHWVQLADTKPGGQTGCALRIQLSPHSIRVYSVDTTFSTFEEAKNACAKDAIADGVIDFIQHGNGQTQPAERDYVSENEGAVAPTAPTAGITLQGFFDALPRPLPEPIEATVAAEINAPSWLNQLVQSARGGKLSLQFIWLADNKYGLHGAVLRVMRPGECKSFLVDPQFLKRADAKAAVCLAAMSQGIGNYIRSVNANLDLKIPAEDRRRAHENILPLILTEYTKIFPGKHLDAFEYSKDKDAFGCTMTLHLGPEVEEESKKTRTWTVPAEYRTKNDAKTGVVLHAFANGAVEYLQFRGEAPPPGYTVLLPPSKAERNKKRKAAEDVEDAGAPSESKKRPKLDPAVPKSEPRTPSLPPGVGLPSRPAAALPLAPTKPSTSKRSPAPALHPPPTDAANLASSTRHAGYKVGRDTIVAPVLEAGERGYMPGPLPRAPPSAPYPHPHHPHPPPPAPRYAPRSADPAVYYDPYAPPAPPFTVEPWRADGYEPPPGTYHAPHAPGYNHESYVATSRPPGRDAYYASFEPAAGHPAYDAYNAAFISGHAYAPRMETVDDAYYPQRDGRSVAQPTQRHGAGYGAYAAPEPPRIWQPGPHDGHARPRSTQHSTGAGRYQGPESWERGPRVGPAPRHSSSEASSSWSQGKADPTFPATSKRSHSASDGLTGSGTNFAQGPFVRAKTYAGGANNVVPATAMHEPSPLPALPTPPERLTRSHKAALLEHCAKLGQAPPQFSSSEEEGLEGKRYKVWLIMGTEKLELPTTFSSVEEGEDRLSKKVILRLRDQANKQ